MEATPASGLLRLLLKCRCKREPRVHYRFEVLLPSLSNTLGQQYELQSSAHGDPERIDLALAAAATSAAAPAGSPPAAAAVAAAAPTPRTTHAARALEAAMAAAPPAGLGGGRGAGGGGGGGRGALAGTPPPTTPTPTPTLPPTPTPETAAAMSDAMPSGFNMESCVCVRGVFFLCVCQVRKKRVREKRGARDWSRGTSDSLALLVDFFS